MLFHRRIIFAEGVFTLPVGFGTHELPIRIERDLGVDNHVTALGQVHDHVENQAVALGRLTRNLALILRALFKPRKLERTSELHERFVRLP